MKITYFLTVFSTTPKSLCFRAFSDGSPLHFQYSAQLPAISKHSINIWWNKYKNKSSYPLACNSTWQILLLCTKSEKGKFIICFPCRNAFQIYWEHKCNCATQVNNDRHFSFIHCTTELCSKGSIKKCRHTYLQHRMKHVAYESELYISQINLFSKKVCDWETIGGFLKLKHIKFLDQEERWRFSCTYQRENLAMLQRMLSAIKWIDIFKGNCIWCKM